MHQKYTGKKKKLHWNAEQYGLVLNRMRLYLNSRVGIKISGKKGLKTFIIAFAFKDGN